MSLPLSTTELIACTATVMSILAAGYERFRNRKKELKTETEQELLSSAKTFQAQSDIFRKAADDNALMYQKERDEHTKTREYWHEQANKFNVTMLEHKAQIVELQARPDYSSMLRIMEEQQKTCAQILRDIQELLLVFKTVYAHK